LLSVIAASGGCAAKEPSVLKIALVLIAAHAVVDFMLQPNWLIRRKIRFPFLVLHSAVHAILTYIILQSWGCWQPPLFIFLMHGLIDSIKRRQGKETATAFAVDQGCHLLSLIGLSWLLVHFSWLPAFSGIGYQPIIYIAGFISAVYGSGYFVGYFAKGILKTNRLEIDGLKNGGKMIGQLERALIFLFVFINQPGAIGFLVAAKSILRFQEAKEQKHAEYVLIGTLLSFSLAIALSVGTMWAARQ